MCAVYECAAAVGDAEEAKFAYAVEAYMGADPFKKDECISDCILNVFVFSSHDIRLCACAIRR